MHIGRAFLVVGLLGVVACETSGIDETDASTDGDAGMDASDGPRRDFGSGNGMTTDSGTMTLTDAAVADAGEEGAPCVLTGNECGSGLACVDTGRFNLGFCSRPCEADDECESEEACISHTGLLRDAHCVNLESEEFGLCGEALTAVCEPPRRCLTFPDRPVGVCVGVCLLDTTGDSDGGVDDSDAGTTPQDAGAPDPSLVDCNESQICAEGVIQDPTHGVCAMPAERGEECGLDLGLICQADDICSREDPMDAEEAPRCRKLCGDGEECDDGEVCTPRPGTDLSVCL